MLTEGITGSVWKFHSEYMDLCCRNRLITQNKYIIYQARQRMSNRLFQENEYLQQQELI